MGNGASGASRTGAARWVGIVAAYGRHRALRVCGICCAAPLAAASTYTTGIANGGAVRALTAGSGGACGFDTAAGGGSR